MVLNYFIFELKSIKNKNFFFENLKKRRKENAKKVYYFNEHSDGVRFRFMWSRTAMLMRNKFLYTYVPNRKSKHKLFEKIINGKEYQLLEGRYSPNTRFKTKLKRYE